jgi:hypothetical protein
VPWRGQLRLAGCSDGGISLSGEWAGMNDNGRLRGSALMGLCSLWEQGSGYATGQSHYEIDFNFRTLNHTAIHTLPEQRHMILYQLLHSP